MIVATPQQTQRPTAPRRGRSPLIVVIIGIALVLVAAALVLGIDRGTRSHSTQGSGVAGAESRTVTDFTGVELAGAINVNVRVGGPRRVVVHADDNLLDRVTARVRSGILVIDTHGSFTANSPTYVDVTTPALVAADLSGSGELAVAAVAARTFTATLAGSGVLSVSGRADQVDATVSGSGSLRLGSLVGKDVRVAVAGTGEVAVQATDSLDASVSGTGAIRYTGSPGKVTTHVSGTGTVTAG